MPNLHANIKINNHHYAVFRQMEVDNIEKKTYV